MFDSIDLGGIGIFQGNTIRTLEIIFDEETRKFCEQNACRNYGKTWACPPAIGTFDECKDQCLGYTHMFVFSAKYDLEDSLDWDSIEDALKNFPHVCDRLNDAIRDTLTDYLILSNEGCSRCATCTYPDSACRFPEKLYQSLEGQGILVNKLAEAAGINYINGQNTVTFFGAVLFNGDKL